PELGDRERHGRALPLNAHSIAIERQRSLLEPLAGSVPCAQRLDAAEQRRHAREQVLDAGAFGEVVVGAEPQTGYGVELALAGSQKDDRKLGRLRPQLAA